MIGVPQPTHGSADVDNHDKGNTQAGVGPEKGSEQEPNIEAAAPTLSPRELIHRRMAELAAQEEEKSGTDPEERKEDE